MTNIIVAGYPKSGCTWVTRLVAELVGCPVAGFWNSKQKEIAIEGQHRVSDFRCFKSHHQLSELGVDLNRADIRVIYVLRDPRDIAVSGAHHFDFDRYPRLTRLFSLLPKGRKLYRHTLHRWLAPESYRMEKMTDALLHGSVEVHNWCRVSWSAHRRPYEASGVPVIRYEDLLAAPREQCAKILRHLGIERSDEEIDAAIRSQSFANKKAQFLKTGETGRAKFLRVGASGQWRQKLPAKAQELFAQNLGDELRECGYAVS
jgi:hypothetical protein